MTCRKVLNPALAIFMALACWGTGAAQTREKQPPAASRPGESPQVEVRESQEPGAVSDAFLQKSISDLSEQIRFLTREVRRLREATQRSSDAMELLLEEERLDRIETQIRYAKDRKSDLIARERDINRRIGNIQQEMLLRGVLRREEGETAIRAELDHQLHEVRVERATYEERLSRLEAEAERVRSRIDRLLRNRKPLDVDDEKPPERRSANEGPISS